ncbi:MAG: FHA domain-containing protein [Clostridiales bacterium]|nr:FHA domain-containing protein [Clostridiales bacterium]
MLLGNETLIWILVGAVFISLGLSAFALVMQIRRGRADKQTPVAKAKANSQGGPPAPPPQSWQPMDVQMQQGPWVPPSQQLWQNDGDFEEKTQALFSGPQSSVTLSRGVQGPPQGDAWQVNIQETGPAGTRSYEVIVSGEFPIGRNVDRGLQITNATVSGLQCMMIAGPECVFVKNRSGSNVTRLNGVKLDDTRPLKVGDTLSMGSIQLSLQGIFKNAAH